jgi:hypothetical protein
MVFEQVTPAVGPLLSVTAEPRRILSAVCGSGPVFGCIAWHTAPEPPNQEAVYICKMLGGPSDYDQISEGADPDCLRIENRSYLSWIVKDAKTGLWTINLSTFENEMHLSSTASVASNVANLATRPYLSQFEDEPCLIYLNANPDGETEIHTNFISSHQSFDERLAVESPTDMIVKFSSNHLVAAIETRNELSLLRFNGGNWELINKIPNNGGRFDFAVREDTAMFVMEMDSGGRERIDTLVVNLSNGFFDHKSSICEYGRFPSIAAVPDGRWLISWVGSPAIPLDLQESNQVPYDGKAHIDVLNEIRSGAETTKTDAEKGPRSKSEMEEIWNVNHVPPWAPLWLGIMTDSGQCADTYGPLGGGTDENFGTQISFHGKRGILIWRSRNSHAAESEEGCFLKAREIVFA